MQDLHVIQMESLVKRALEEDWGNGDWTTDLCVKRETQATAKIIAKQETVVAGVDVAQCVMRMVDKDIDIRVLKGNGTLAKPQDVILALKGPAKSILKAERVALNFMGRMCGIATMTKRYVDCLTGSKVQILDTRKTTPGLRLFEKAATAIGGARNHRFGLSDGVLVKENHIRAAGGITAALSQLLDALPPTIKVEVETSNLAEVQEALAAGADIIMLDNMTVAEMHKAVALVGGKALVEASGNIRLDNLKEVAATGVNFVSTSAIITAAVWADLSLLFDV